MRKHSILGLIFTAIGVPCSWAQTSLTGIETKWLEAAQPVLEFALDQGLPIDVIVQPQSKTGDVPLAMGVRNNRCKLVLAMRGNADAEATLAGVPLNKHAMLIEAMAAHEIAHCWRYAHGVWHALPAGFVEQSQATGDDQELTKQKQQMRATRREEGYADLVGLAWILRTHPDNYDEVHAWFERIRRDQPLPGSFHDTRVWLALVENGSAFDIGSTPFEQAQGPWAEGLRFEE